MQHRASKMSGDLHVYTKFEKPVRVKENTDDEDTQRFKQMKGIEKYVGVVRV